MGDFSPDWLTLREGADARARSARLTGRLVERLAAAAPGDAATPLHLLDLGCGTGANLRYLAPRLASALGRPQHWICLDRDPRLLAALADRTRDWARALGWDLARSGDALAIRAPGIRWEVRVQQTDLAQADSLDLAPGTAVLASALLDLVSAPWLLELLHACAQVRAPLLLALTYDGRADLTPRHALDGLVLALVNAHQGKDKGFGPALGPSAPARLAYLGEGLGFEVDTEESDWELGPDEGELQRALVAGWAAAALEQAQAEPGAGDPAAVIARWQTAREAEIAARRSRIRVGHADALLLPR